MFEDLEMFGKCISRLEWFSQPIQLRCSRQGKYMFPDDAAVAYGVRRSATFVLSMMTQAELSMAEHVQS